MGHRSSRRHGRGKKRKEKPKHDASALLASVAVRRIAHPSQTESSLAEERIHRMRWATLRTASVTTIRTADARRRPPAIPARTMIRPERLSPSRCPASSSKFLRQAKPAMKLPGKIPGTSSSTSPNPIQPHRPVLASSRAVVIDSRSSVSSSSISRFSPGCSGMSSSLFTEERGERIVMRFLISKDLLEEQPRRAVSLG